jgi:hypothetical protein
MRAEAAPGGAVDCMEVKMPARVAIKGVGNPLAESPRVPEEG